MKANVEHKLPTELLSLGGEYAVASELCKRGLYAQLTLGHHKRIDILIETEHRMFRMEVKAKQKKQWPAVKGIYRRDDFLVLVDLKDKRLDEHPDFYVLNLNDWKQVIRKEKQRYGEVKIDDKLCISYADGWKGLNLEVDQVSRYRESWDKITGQLKEGGKLL